MKCNTCANENYCYDDNHQLARDGCSDNGFAAYTPITNADRIRAMSDEELADWIANYETRCYLRLNPLADCNTKNFAKQILGWLKAPVKQEVDNGT